MQQKSIHSPMSKVSNQWKHKLVKTSHTIIIYLTADSNGQKLYSQSELNEIYILIADGGTFGTFPAHLQL